MEKHVRCFLIQNSTVLCDNWKPEPGDAMEPRPGGVLSRTRSNSSDATEILKMKILETNSWNQPTILEKMQVHIKCK